MTKRIDGKKFFDTNVLIYAFERGDRRSDRAQGLLAEGGVTGVQALNEFATVARRKLSMSWVEVSEALVSIRILCPSPVAVSVKVHEAALAIAERHRYSLFDSLVIAAPQEAGCDTLYSEGMQDGQVIDGLTLRNPFRLGRA